MAMHDVELALAQKVGHLADHEGIDGRVGAVGQTQCQPAQPHHLDARRHGYGARRQLARPDLPVGYDGYTMSESSQFSRQGVDVILNAAHTRRVAIRYHADPQRSILCLWHCAHLHCHSVRSTAT